MNTPSPLRKAPSALQRPAWRTGVNAAPSPRVRHVVLQTRATKNGEPAQAGILMQIQNIELTENMKTGFIFKRVRHDHNHTHTNKNVTGGGQKQNPFFIYTSTLAY